MPTPRAFDHRAINDLASAQGGIVAFSQLVSLGMSNSTIGRWTRTGGVWQRLLPGTYLVHRGTPTADERLHAAQLYAGPHGQLTGVAALHLHGLRNVPVPLEKVQLHLLVPASQQTQSTGFVTLERTRYLPEAVCIRGLQVAPLPRAVFDAGRRTPDRQATRAFTLEAVQRRLLTIDDLRREISRGQRQWTAILRDVLAEAKSGVLSVPEAELRKLLQDAHFPEPLWNPRLETYAGEFIAEPDAYFKEFGLALEVDSRRFHFEDGDAYRKTWRRHERYTRHGIVALRLMPTDIHRNPDSIVTAVRDTLAAQRGRSLPEITVVPRTLRTPTDGTGAGCDDRNRCSTAPTTGGVTPPAESPLLSRDPSHLRPPRRRGCRAWTRHPQT